MQVDNFNVPNLAERLLEAKLSPPSIVKPQVACGVADAHSMVMFALTSFSWVNSLYVLYSGALNVKMK